MVGPLVDFGLREAYHCTPLHYLAFILRSQRISSKRQLQRAGFSKSHFRSTSRAQDIARGFEDFVHLALNSQPAILRAKLAKGFPHAIISVPIEAIEKQEYLLCRYNIARCRNIVGNKKAPPQCDANGRYRAGLRLPVASSASEKAALLKHNALESVEVLIRAELPLPSETTVTVFSSADSEAILKLSAAGRLVVRVVEDHAYPQNPRFRAAALAALERSIVDQAWKGAGLEFDRL
jgi:hypothetical protein